MAVEELKGWEKFKKGWIELREQDKPLSDQEYREHLKNLEPEKLVDYLRYYQSSVNRWNGGRWAGVLMMVGSVATRDIFSQLGFKGDNYDTGFVSIDFIGALTLMISAHVYSGAKGTLDFVMDEVSNRLVQPK